MDIIAENDGRIYVRANVDRPSDFTSPFPGHLFPCLLWDHEGHFTEPARSNLAQVLLEAGCRYVVCGGQNCQAWHDAIELEFVKAHLDDSENVWESAHVMTTWHEGESPDEAAFFFVMNTNFDFHDFNRYLVLHIGAGATENLVDAAVRKYALSTNAV
jgi:hypothetical protein